MAGLVDNAKLFVKRNASTILTIAGGVGTVATAVMAVKETPKAIILLKHAKEEKGEELTKIEVVKTAGLVYIPAILTGAATLACIFGANVLNRHQQAALMSAYALLDNSYKEYKKKADELFGEESGARIREEIAKDKYEETDISVNEDKELFYDYFSGRYFESTRYAVMHAEYELNRTLMMRDYVYLNEFYEHLGIEPIESGFELGWSRGSNLAHYWQDWIDFNHEKVVHDDGLECHIVKMMAEPVLGFYDYA